MLRGCDQLDRECLAVMYKYNQELWSSIISKYKDTPIVIAGDTVADIYGWTSTYGKWSYIGDKSYEDDNLVCVAEVMPKTYKCSCMSSDGGCLRYLDNVSAVCSLVEHSKTDWGLIALYNILRYARGFWWIEALQENGLIPRLMELLDEAAALGITDPDFKETTRRYIERDWPCFHYDTDKEV